MPIYTTEQDRETVSAAELESYLELGSLIVDERRRRPLWFDGRFLDAEALNQQQRYYISKQEDVAQLIGSGVLSGLMVQHDSTRARTITLGEGRGITPAGKLVVLEEALTVDLANLAQIQKMNLQFELAQKPAQTLSNSSGIYIIGLRPVEFSSEPVTSYPTEINGKRSVDDGSVFEATAVTLIPYTDQGASNELADRQKHIAAEIFVHGSQKGQPADILPLAMLAINKGVIQWLDPYLVRRMISTQKHALTGLGASPRVLREAFYTQYQHQLNHIVNARQTRPFAAAEEFNYLPPAGPMPLAAVNLNDFSQVYFPIGMDVELSIIPDDELFMMLEESFSLPPIDLSLSEEKAQATSVMVMLAVPRHKIRSLSLKLPSLVNPLKSIAADAVSGFTPLDVLSNIGVEADDVSDLESAESVWREAFQDADVSLWYTRRRTLNFKTEIVGEPVSLVRDEAEEEQQLQERVNQINFRDPFNQLFDRSTIAARAELTSLLTKVKPSSLMLKGAINEFSKAAQSSEGEQLNRLKSLKVTERFSANSLGEGLSRLEATADDYQDDEQLANTLAETERVPELDAISSRLKDDDLRVFSNDLIKTLRGGEPTTAARRLIDEKLIQTRAIKSTAFLNH